tara:strand:- start:200 stop:790 length:591 start_codon:yes stop_codon:yes gene_type:complete
MTLKNLFTKFYKKKNNNFFADKTSSIRNKAEILNFSKDRSNIKIGKETIIRGKLIVFGHSGKIEIGDECIVNHNVEIWSAKNVKIGNRVMIAHNVNIIDTDGHPVDSKNRYKHFKQIKEKGFIQDKDDKILKDIRSSEIIIEDDVWIGIGAYIQRGVTIGRESIIAPLSYVVQDVPPNSVVSGNPAQLIRTNLQNK